MHYPASYICLLVYTNARPAPMRAQSSDAEAPLGLASGHSSVRCAYPGTEPATAASMAHGTSLWPWQRQVRLLRHRAGDCSVRGACGASGAAPDTGAADCR